MSPGHNDRVGVRPALGARPNVRGWPHRMFVIPDEPATEPVGLVSAVSWWGESGVVREADAEGRVASQPFAVVGPGEAAEEHYGRLVDRA